MKYMLLLANAPDAWEEATSRPDHMTDDGVIEDWAEYTRALHDAGVLIGGHALHGPEAGTTVRVRGNKRLLVDGPFADTKEHLIGYYVIEVPDLDTALNWAARVPNVRTGVVEVRPIQPDSDTATVLASSTAPGAP